MVVWYLQGNITHAVLFPISLSRLSTLASLGSCSRCSLIYVACTRHIVTSVSDHFRRPDCQQLPCHSARVTAGPAGFLAFLSTLSQEAGQSDWHLYIFTHYLIISYMCTLKYGHIHPTFPSSNLSQLPHRVPLTTSSSSPPLFLYKITQGLISATCLLSVGSLPVAAGREG